MPPKKGYRGIGAAAAGTPAAEQAGAPPPEESFRRAISKDRASAGLLRGKAAEGLSTALSAAQISTTLKAMKESIRQLPRLGIETITLSIVNPQELEKRAVIEITNTDWEGPGSVNDPKMGVVEDGGRVCATCHQTNATCPGHIGMIRFTYPIYHPRYVDVVVNVLRCVCNSCGGLLVTKDILLRKGILKMNGITRLKRIKEFMGDTSFECHQHHPGARPCGPNPYYLAAKSKEEGAVKFVNTKEDAKKESPKTRPIFRTPEERLTTTLLSVFEILDAISPSDAELLGFNPPSHPRHLILFALPVMPTIDRPMVAIGGELHQNPFTIFYREIVETNEGLKKTELNSYQKDEGRRQLVKQVAALMDNSKGAVMTGGQPLKGIQQEISGKDGEIRRNMMGKRVSGYARSVIGPGPQLPFGYIGIPVEIAEELFYRDTVTEWNQIAMQTLFQQGKIKRLKAIQGPKANVQVAVDATMRHDYKLQAGDEVERELLDGDIILFNRQPTLLLQSIMAARIKIIPQHNILIGLWYTTPLNADFDGDEINLHVPQTIEARVEAEELLSTQRCLLSASRPGPAMGAVYDAPLGVYLLTRDVEIARGPKWWEEGKRWISGNEDLGRNLESSGLWETLPAIPDVRWMMEEIVPRGTPSLEQPVVEVLLDRRTTYVRLQQIPWPGGHSGMAVVRKLGDRWEELMRPATIDYNIYHAVLDRLVQMDNLDTLNERLTKHGVPKYSGRAIFSAMLPEDFYYERSYKIGDAMNYILIQDGVLITGLITKKDVGPSPNGIVHWLARERPDYISSFLTNMAWVIDEYLTLRGFTIGVSDCHPSEKGKGDDQGPKIMRGRIEAEVEGARIRIEALGPRREDPIAEERRQYERRLILQQVSSKVQRVGADLFSPDNPFTLAVEAGAKGSEVTFGQSSRSVGQYFKGIGPSQPTLTGGKRCLPYFDYDEDGTADLTESGFCLAGYGQGLDPSGVFFADESARGPITDTAMNTPITGYMQRKITKALEDVHIAADGSLRNGANGVVSFVYHDDSYSTGFLVPVKHPVMGDIYSPFDLKRLAKQINYKWSSA